MYKNASFSNYLHAKNRRFLKDILNTNNQNYLRLIEESILKYWKNSNTSQVAIAEDYKNSEHIPNDLRSKEFILKEKYDGLKLNVNAKPTYVLHKIENENEYNIVNLFSLKKDTNIDEFDSSIKLSPYLSENFKIENKILLYETLRNLFNNNYKTTIKDISEHELQQGLFEIAIKHFSLSEFQAAMFNNIVSKILNLERKDINLEQIANSSELDKSLMSVSLSIRNFFNANKLIDLVQNKELCITLMDRLKNNLTAGYNDLKFKYIIVTKDSQFEYVDYEKVLKKIEDIKENESFDLRISPNEFLFEINFLKKTNGQLFYNNISKEIFDIDSSKKHMEKQYAIDNIDKLLNQLNKTETQKQVLKIE